MFTVILVWGMERLEDSKKIMPPAGVKASLSAYRGRGQNGPGC